MNCPSAASRSRGSVLEDAIVAAEIIEHPAIEHEKARAQRSPAIFGFSLNLVTRPAAFVSITPKREIGVTVVTVASFPWLLWNSTSFANIDIAHAIAIGQHEEIVVLINVFLNPLHPSAGHRGRSGIGQRDLKVLFAVNVLYSILEFRPRQREKSLFIAS